MRVNKDQRKIKDLTNEVYALKGQLDGKQVVIDELEDGNSSLRIELEEYKRKLRETYSSIPDSQEVRRLQEQIEGLEEKNKRQTNAYTNLQTTYQKLQNDYRKLEDMYNEKTLQFDEFAYELANKTNDVEYSDTYLVIKAEDIQKEEDIDITQHWENLANQFNENEMIIEGRAFAAMLHVLKVMYRNNNNKNEAMKHLQDERDQALSEIDIVNDKLNDYDNMEAKMHNYQKALVHMHNVQRALLLLSDAEEQ